MKTRKHQQGPKRQTVHFIFLCAGHFAAHMFMLIFATVAALALTREWGLSYAQLVPYATPCFIAFGLGALPAGWAADRWSRPGMMAVFFLGAGLSSLAASLAETPVQMAAGLFALGLCASIYHPVGLALVVQGRKKTGVPLATNGIFGNLGVAFAPLMTGLFIDNLHWRDAFIWPGAAAIIIGLAYLVFIRTTGDAETSDPKPAGAGPNAQAGQELTKSILVRVFAVIFFTTALGGLVFQSTTFALPKIFSERLAGLAGSATMLGWYASMVFAVAAVGQLIVGFLVDRFPVRRVFAVNALAQAALLALMIGAMGYSALAAAMVCMLAVFGQIPINDVLIGRITHRSWRSRVFGLRYIVTFSVMAGSLPLISAIYSYGGFDLLFMILSGAALLIFTAVLLLPPDVSAGEKT